MEKIQANRKVLKEKTSYSNIMKSTTSRLQNLKILDEYETTPSASRNILMSNVKQMYEKGTIRRFDHAEGLMKLLQNNKMNDFDTRFSKIEKAENTKMAKQQAKHIVKTIEDDSSNQQKHIIRIKNKKSELPTFELEFKQEYTVFDAAWHDGVDALIKMAKDKIMEKKNIKIVVGVEVIIAKPVVGGEEQTKTIHAHTMPESVYNDDDVAKTIKGKKVDLHERLDSRIEHQAGSGWTVKKINGLFITTYTQTPSRGSSHIPTPSTLNNSKFGLINIKNYDNECFKWCMLYHQSEKTVNGHRLTVLKKIKDKYDWSNVGFPASLNDIETFEHNNKVCVNIYGHSGEREINPIRLGTIGYVGNDNINLLLIKDEDDNGHYVYIKKLEHLIHTCKTGYYKDRMYCPYCRKTIPATEIYEEHLMSKHFDCHNNCNLELPAEGTTMKFKNYKNMLERPFIVYADFECSLIPTDMADKIAKHEPNSAAAYFVCTFDSSRNKLYKFEGRDCVINMIEQLRLLASRCVKEQQENQKMEMNEEDWETHKAATRCYLCKGAFNKKNCKVRDHDHRTGKYRGPCHNNCNINYFTNRYLPIVFHNLRGYDSHLILKKAFEVVGAEKINAIPNSGEKFMTFSIGDMKFIDSLQFMASSLDKLTESLKMKNDDDPYMKFHNMKKHFNKDEMELICRKGSYPYEFIDSWEKIHHPELPPQEAFYSKLKLEGISDDDYKHAQNVYTSFKCRSFYDYHMLYLKTDVILLADIFENFRAMCLEHYRLDPANYLTAASLAWDAMLLKTNAELDLITNPEILDMFEKSKRGGLTFVGSKRYAKANNKDMGEHFDKTKDSSYITYVDANNLYGWAMVEALPYKDIKFEKVAVSTTSGSRETPNDGITLDTILNTADDAETGYLVEADLEFPIELHDVFKQFPPCPESLTPNEEWFSDYQKEVKMQTNSTTSTKKLIPHLMKHEKYCLHYRNLKFIEKLGVKIKLHRVISFKQSKWMAEYINNNNRLRTEAKKIDDEFLVSLFKLLNNSVFGKTCENVRNRENMHLTIDATNAVKWFSKLEFKSATYIDGLYLISTHKTSVVYDKPMYVGCAILDISKVRMMDFHYNTIENNFKGKYELIYSDTDSLVYHIHHKNLYKWMNDNPHEFDLSNMKGKFKNDDNCQVLGKMKSEVGDKIITEFVGLNPKSYAYKYCNREVKKAKGVSLSVSEKTMCFDDYKRVMTSNNIQTRPIHGIRSFNQQIYSTLEDKVVLNSFYDKLTMVNDIDCIPYGYNPK